MVQKVDQNGNTLWGQNGLLISYSDGWGGPELVPDYQGGAIVFWHTGSPGAYFCQRIGSNGAALWPSNITIDGYYDNEGYEVAPDGSGGALFAWSDANTDDFKYRAYVQRIDSNGGKLWGSGKPVATERPDIWQFRINLINDGSGGAIVVWGEGPSTAQGNVYAQRFDSGGTAQWGTGGRQIFDGPEDCDQRLITNDTKGGAFIAWNYGSSYTNQYEVRGQRIDNNGTMLWGADGKTLCPAHTRYSSANIRMVADGEGGVYLSCCDGGFGVDSWCGVQRINSQGSFMWQQATPVSADNAYDTYRGGEDYNISCDGNGNLAVVWFCAKRLVYGQKISPNGDGLWYQYPNCLSKALPPVLLAGNQYMEGGSYPDEFTAVESGGIGKNWVVGTETDLAPYPSTRYYLTANLLDNSLITRWNPLVPSVYPGETFEIEIEGRYTHFKNGISRVDLIPTPDSSLRNCDPSKCFEVLNTKVVDETHAIATLRLLPVYGEGGGALNFSLTVITGDEQPFDCMGDVNIREYFFYFAEGTCRPNFDSYICLQNPGGTPAFVNLTYMKGDGSTDSYHLYVPANTRATVSPRDKLETGDDAAHDFSCKVECTNGQQIIAERPMYFNYKGIWTGGHDVVGALAPASTFYFAEGTCRPNFDPYICIQNPGSTDALVTITYMKGDGSTDSQTLTVGKNSRSTVNVRDKLGTGDDAAHDFSAKVECTNGQQIIAERPMYFNYNGVWTGGHDVVGATSPSTAFYFAEGTCRPNFDPYFCIQNPGSTDALVTITYMKGDGSTDSQTLTVGKNSRSTVNVRDKLGTGDDAAHDFSAKVECTNGQQIIAERPMYFNYNGIWTGGHDVVGFAP